MLKGNNMDPTRKAPRTKPKFEQHKDDASFKVISESLTVEEKMKILDEIGRPELIEVFKGWKPRQTRRKKRGAPLDQRVAITVNDYEKVSLDNEMRAIKRAGERITASQFIRNRALSIVDIAEWDLIARASIEKLQRISETQTELRKRKRILAGILEETTDPEDEGIYEMEISEINRDLDSLVGKSANRKNRLSGRMSMAEAETVRWRAQRLSISSSDYLRMVIFGLAPASDADAHLSLDTRLRFYVSIMDVAENGWGKPPTIYECSQCINYTDEIALLQDRIKQLESFS
jgi:hypothetical protein